MPEARRSPGGSSRARGAWPRVAVVLGAFAVFGGVVGVAAWAGCGIYDPSLLLPAPETGAPDSFVAPEAGPPDVAADVPQPCPEVFPPAKPTASSHDAGAPVTFVAALHTLDLGIETDGAAPPVFGYDLDGVYTCCDAGPESCTSPTTPAAQHCDENGGRDNSGGQLFQTLASQSPGTFSTSSISQRLQDGVYSILLQVIGYNGAPDDEQVTAVLYTSDGVQGADGGPATAKWDGTDVWSIDEGSVLFPDAGTIIGSYADGQAYVAGGTLVMHVNFPISLGTAGTGTVTLSLAGGVLTGQIVPAGAGTYSVTNGQVTGRWPTAQVLETIQDLSVFGSPLCKDSAFYPVFKQKICQAADIMSDPSLDRTGKTCDGVSVAVGFTADPANLGTVVATPIKTSLCDGGPQPDQCP